MIIGDRLRALREEKKLSQGDIEKRTGLLRCYISRVENGPTVPAIETLEKLARAMEVPMYELFYDGDQPPQVPLRTTAAENNLFGSSGKDANLVKRIRQCLGHMDRRSQQLLLVMAKKMAQPPRRKAA